jgi:tetratricopeptide (TPR) repeat protein
VTVDPWRVAQIVNDRGPGDAGLRGSGYLVAPGRVLTAAHVVAGALSIRVRLDVGQGTEIDIQADSWWADPAEHEGTDLAIIVIPLDATKGRSMESARFGRIADRAAVFMVEAFGFPLFKLRQDFTNADQHALFRDLEQVAGHAPVAANRRQGTLAVYLDDPPPNQPSKREPSPWEGMSGGPVWTAGRIVGVVAEHHSSEGPGRLTARRIDRAYEQLPASDLDRLVELLGLAPVASGLPDVIPHEQDQLMRSAYLAQVRDIAPDLLIGRERELADWDEFCAGTDLYAWWQAGPWAGKSAMASWFVTHPPVGVDIMSFFITGRLIGQADSSAFLNAMIEQLGSLYPTNGRPPAVAGAWAGMWWDLLESAAAEAEERARRLVVVVDGLDEDEAGASPRRGRPSIASLLPRRPPSGVRFIVTSRPDPGLPDDLPSDHPLRTCRPRRLSASPVAKDIELRAKQELRDLLAGDQTAIDLVGYIAGSGGGLTRSDLSALTGAPPHKLDPILRGVSGRSLYTRASTDPQNPQMNPATRVYLFAHETLRVTAEEQLGDDLASYRGNVHKWIGSYADAGWPDTTPSYAINGYLRLLVATSDVMRLSALARDPRRHAFLLGATGSDYAALTEIGIAQSLIVDQTVLDLNALVELAAYRHVLSIRNQFIPPDLPIVWAWLAHFDRAEDLARTITDPNNRNQALSRLASAIAQTGDPDRAEAVARTISDPDAQAQALTGLATAAAQAGDAHRAYRLATAAEALASTITDPDPQARALTNLASAIAQAGDPDRAETLARTTTNPHAQAQALASLAVAATQAGDPNRAYLLAADAEALASTITDPDARNQTFVGLVAAAQTSDLDYAEDLTRAITDLAARAQALTGLATAAAQAGDPERADRLATTAEALARAITDPDAQAQALTNLVSAVAQAGDPDRADALARTISDSGAQPWVLASLASAIAQAGDPDRGEDLALVITDPDVRA